VTAIAAALGHFDTGDVRPIQRRLQETRLADVRQEAIDFGELRAFSSRHDDRLQRDHVIVREHAKACYVADKRSRPAGQQRKLRLQ